GLGIELAEISDYKIKEAMEDLAIQINGGIPDPLNAFTDAIYERETTFDYYDYRTIIEETAGQIAQGSQYVGDRIIEAGKGSLDFISKYHKIIIIVGGALITFHYMKK